MLHLELDLLQTRDLERMRVSRSQLYARALEAFVKEHRGLGVREALERVYGAARGLRARLSSLGAGATGRT